MKRELDLVSRAEKASHTGMARGNLKDKLRLLVYLAVDDGDLAYVHRLGLSWGCSLGPFTGMGLIYARGHIQVHS